MQPGVVLVIAFRRIERLQRHHLGDDLVWEYLRLLELRDIGLRDALLLVIAEEDDRPILRSLIRISDDSAV